MNKIKSMIIELRAPFLTVTILPVLIGTALAHRAGVKIDIAAFWLIMSGFIFLHLGTNVLNDYFDWKNGTDNVNKKFISPFTGGSRLIQANVLKPRVVLIEGLAMFIVATALFIPLIHSRGIILFWVLLFSLVAGGFYTAPPFKWAHKGFGELLIFASFGPLMVATSYYILTGTVTSAVLAASILPGLLAASVVDINEFPDHDADKKTGKANLIVRLGTRRGKYSYFIMIVLAYISVVAAVMVRLLPVTALFALLALPFSINASLVLARYHDKPAKLAPACGMTIIAHLVGALAIAVVLYIK